MFILPAMVATGKMEVSWGSVAFSIFMLLQLWMLIAEYAYECMATVFEFKRKRLFKFLNLHRYEKEETRSKSGFEVLLLAFLSYLFMVYGFGVIYTFIANVYPNSFSAGSLTFIQGVYFSLVTSSTVGFGDITPTTDLSRVVVMLQIIMSMAYVVILFSSAVSYARDGKSSPNKQRQSDA